VYVCLLRHLCWDKVVYVKKTWVDGTYRRCRDVMDWFAVVRQILFLATIHPNILSNPVYTIQPVVKPVVKWVWQPVECLYVHDTTGCQSGCQTGCTTGWQPVVSFKWNITLSLDECAAGSPLRIRHAADEKTVSNIWPNYDFGRGGSGTQLPALVSAQFGMRE